MNDNTHPFFPENYVSLILNNFMRLENISQNVVEAIKKIDAYTDTDILDNKMVWKVPFSSIIELAEKLKELNRLGFLFVGGADGWPPSEIFIDLREKNLLEGRFKEVTWRGPGDWVIRER
jgi:hypothetical protein